MALATFVATITLFTLLLLMRKAGWPWWATLPVFAFLVLAVVRLVSGKWLWHS